METRTFVDPNSLVCTADWNRYAGGAKISAQEQDNVDKARSWYQKFGIGALWFRCSFF